MKVVTKFSKLMPGSKGRRAVGEIGLRSLVDSPVPPPRCYCFRGLRPAFAVLLSVKKKRAESKERFIG